MDAIHIKVGIIGGSGLSDPKFIENRTEHVIDTPYGKPSDALVSGKINGIDCVLLARHGRHHTINPSNINYRANIAALKSFGCTHILASTACGSLQEQYAPGQILFPDQFIDATKKRESTFYDGKPSSPVGVCHIPMHTPFCPHTRKLLIETAEELQLPYHASGTLLTVEGPRFGTRAESLMWKREGIAVLNMTTVPEVVLAKEAGLSYAAIALVTDYDCWRESSMEHVSVEFVMATMHDNADKFKQLIIAALPKIVKKDWTDVIKENQSVATGSVMLPPSVEEKK